MGRNISKDARAPRVPVGGIYILVDKFALLTPYIARAHTLFSTILAVTAATALYVKHIKRRKEKR